MGNIVAIRFVLSDAYTNMSREERQSLLHEGSGPSNVNAYVEIIFDNSDNRFPVSSQCFNLLLCYRLVKMKLSCAEQLV